MEPIVYLRLFFLDQLNRTVKDHTQLFCLIAESQESSNLANRAIFLRSMKTLGFVSELNQISDINAADCTNQQQKWRLLRTKI